MITTTAVEVGVVLAVNRAEHRVGETTERTATENNGDDDDDSALDESEQTLRPADVAINQQRVQAWHPILDPVWVIVALFYLGIILIPVGWKIDQIQEDTVQEEIVYDFYHTPYDANNTPGGCGIGDDFNAEKTCFLNFTAPRYMKPPIFVHYGLKNFNQNHRNYYRSRDVFQLKGKVGGQDRQSELDCQPLNKLGNITLNPCGLVANTLFNDRFELINGRDPNNEELEMIETGIAWQSDVEYVYDQPDGFNYSWCQQCPLYECETCDTCCNPGECGKNNTPWTDPVDGRCYRYFYPEDDTTQYLYETYPKIISPIEGVLNEHFIVWMRVATQPDFRKLYGWINQPIEEGETLTFLVHANFVVTRFRGQKSLILGTTSIFGGRNPYIGPIFMGMGVFCLAAGAFFALKQTFRPRKLADPAYLHYKED